MAVSGNKNKVFLELCCFIALVYILNIFLSSDGCHLFSGAIFPCITAMLSSLLAFGGGRAADKVQKEMISRSRAGRAFSVFSLIVNSPQMELEMSIKVNENKYGPK